MTEILLYGIIGDSWDGLDAKSILAQIQATDDDLLLRINSPGGYVMEGLAVYNVLKGVRDSGRKVNVQIDALAASMASVIAMVGENIIMADNALMMIHNPWDCACGDATELRRKADQLDLIRDNLVKIYSAQTGLEADELKAMLEAETWLTADQALAQNFITAIDSAETAQALGCDIQKFGFRNAPNHPAVQGIVWDRAAAAAFFNAKGVTTMSGTNTPAAPVIQPAPAPAPAPVALSQTDIDKATAEATATATAQATAAENERITQIAALCDKHKMDADFRAKALAVGVTVASVRELILDKLATAGDAQNIGGNPAIVVGADERAKWQDGAAAWLLTRFGAANMIRSHAKAQGQQIDLNPGEFRGMSMVDMARETLLRNGVSNIPRDRNEIVKQAFSMGARNAITQTTSDFTVLLENIMHKVLQAAYGTAPDTWSRFCGIGSVADFRPHSRYLKGTFGALDALNEVGEFKTKAIPDGAKETITAKTKGNIINISRQAIVNDDLGAFISMLEDIARAAKLTIEIDVYALLAANPLMNDGVAFFDAAHNNLAGAGAVPSVTVFDAARQAMAKQKDVSNNEFLTIMPSVGLFPLTQGGNARVINGAQYDPDTPNKLQRPNMVNGMLSDIVDTPRITGTEWYFFADKDTAPAIEVAFLDGQQEPFTESRDGWTVDGMEAKVRHDYAVGAVNWRSAYKNPGA